MIAVAIYDKEQYVGTVRVRSFLFRNDDDFQDAAGLLSPSQKRDLARQLAKIPGIHQGHVGDYRWKELFDGQPFSPVRFSG